MSISITEGYVPGCIGRIAQLHAAYYSAANGFSVEFEAKVAREMGGFCESYKQGRDGIWIARSPEIEGSVVIDGTHAQDSSAHLRWFITSESLRGQGVGRQLLARALEFSDNCEYKAVSLWTFAGLDAARHLYELHGFRLVHESLGSQWGTVVREQRFERGEA